ncbi:MAG: hypothetical protein INF93_15710 [Rhodobacter sp.]|nr:hypothetical protein [Rhodobacter sp.]
MGVLASTTGPVARLCRKSPGTGAALCFIGHALIENRSGLIIQGEVAQAHGRAERQAALDMGHRHFPGSTRKLTLGADKGYDAAEFAADLRQVWFGAEAIPRIVSDRPSPPLVAQKSRLPAIDGRTTRHDGCALSRKHRKPSKKAFGWARTIGGKAQTMYRGTVRM